ncbi:hypothetical protein K461DRAFT_266847 [Myriangium duriaei CBS 260.36]|uniref:F-box domain-containing protein n=1 Tax=Myriangium duriaei CBS 260.36 TaxID=1168546 RepID=A0A9P4J5A4_9PEZI|nr:hypothetical protein K461DRAFT_266847 [Myriangium duriaei CBS 260.36]
MSRNIFDKFPVELLLNIVVRLPDLDALDNLLRVSPDVWRLFQSHAVEIVEQVLDSAPIDKDTKTVMRTIAYVYEGCLPVTSIAELRARVTNDSLTHGACRGGQSTAKYDAGGYNGDEWYIRENYIFSPDELPDRCTPATARRILVDHRRISFLTQACLTDCLQRFRQREPRRVADPAWKDGNITIGQIRAGHPPTLPLVVNEIGPPSWCEEQIVARAFWRLQFIKDLRVAAAVARRRCILKGWGKTQRKQLQRKSVVELYDFDALREDIIWGSYGRESRLRDVELAEHSAIRIAEDFLRDRDQQETFPPGSWSRPQPAPQPLPEDQNVLGRHWTPGIERFGSVFPYMTKRFMRKETFDTYRNLGFTIWSEERLDGFGFNPGDSLLDQPGTVFVTWTSVLKAEEVAGVVAFDEQRKARQAKMRELPPLGPHDSPYSR